MSETRLELLEELTRDATPTDKVALIVGVGEGSTADAETIRSSIGLGTTDTVTFKFLTLRSATFEAQFDTTNLDADEDIQFPVLGGAGGVLAIVPSYADETAANAAETANVVYYNEATAKFQITTA